MKKYIITSVLSTIFGALLAVSVYNFFVIKDIRNMAQQSFIVVNAMGTVDEQGISGFDKLVAQTLNKIQESQKK